MYRYSVVASLKEVSDRLAAATEQLESWDFLPQDSVMMIASPLVGEGGVRRVRSLYLVVDQPQVPRYRDTEVPRYSLNALHHPGASTHGQRGPPSLHLSLQLAVRLGGAPSRPQLLAQLRHQRRMLWLVDQVLVLKAVEALSLIHI